MSKVVVLNRYINKSVWFQEAQNVVISVDRPAFVVTCALWCMLGR